MIAKYGKGKLQERVCPKCEYKSEIQTAGVHVLGSGCIKVYSEDDEFQCPRCGFTEDGKKWCFNKKSLQFLFGWR